MASSKGKASAGKGKAKPKAAKVQSKTGRAAARPKSSAKSTGDNPLLERWTAPFEDAAIPERYGLSTTGPRSMRRSPSNRAEIDAIAANPPRQASTTPSRRWNSPGRPAAGLPVFSNLCRHRRQRRHPRRSSAKSRRAWRATASAIFQNEALFRRVDDLYQRRDDP